ncbi:DUF433 domain-containing protein [Pseudomonas sp. BN417]|uniref:DUF433 domain-containing protein n=1 Tax=Pseudomonas sp. BN417 TaxID=2567890 RepID=UPI00245681E8|nr:DUF433 domain-containing protein [Pseudomonas sp. BN417]
MAQVSESAVDNLVEAGEFQTLFFAGSRPRTFDLLGAALTVSLYKAFKEILTAAARQQVMLRWTTLYAPAVLEVVEGLRQTGELAGMGRIELDSVVVNLEKELVRVVSRMIQLTAIKETVHCDSEIQGGRPVFCGTRLPVDITLGRLDAGESFAVLQEDYPYLTLEKIERARAYLAIFPQHSPPLPHRSSPTAGI